MSEPFTGTSRNRPEPPATVELYWCAYCCGSALGDVSELFHLNKRCPGKTDREVVGDDARGVDRAVRVNLMPSRFDSRPGGVFTARGGGNAQGGRSCR